MHESMNMRSPWEVIVLQTVDEPMTSHVVVENCMLSPLAGALDVNR